ncbi:MAG: CdaR family protein [Clostridia bacterium]
MNTEPKRSDSPSFRKALKTMPMNVLRACVHNWPWKLLAFFLAICLWAGLITQDPTLTREHVFTDVPIAITGADTLRRNGLIVLSGLEEDVLTARLRADVPQREYNNVTANYYNPRVDLSRITKTGEQTLRILTSSTTTYGNVQAVSPENITVMVDEYITNYRVPVSIHAIGNYPAGFHGISPSLDPSAVAVSGPKSIVDQIARVYVDFDLSRLPAQAGLVRTALPMRFVDDAGNAITSKLIEVTSADVLLRTIIVEQLLYPTKTLAVTKLSLSTGIPADGYELKSVTASPSTLLAAGDKLKLDGLEAIFTDHPIDISGRSESFVAEVKLRKPSELVYLSSDTVTLHFEIVPFFITRNFNDIKPTVYGQSDKQHVTLSQKAVSVAITGPQTAIEQLKSSMLSIYVDVSQLGEGEHILPLLLHLEGESTSGISYTISPNTVTTTISKTAVK